MQQRHAFPRSKSGRLPFPARRRSALVRSVACAGALAMAAACGGGHRERVSMVGAGDIASCWWRADESTARLLDRIDGVVFTLGDNVYQRGTPAQFARCYGPTWGRHRDRTRPTPGNHDYKTGEGSGYFAYFGRRAGEQGKGWYSYQVDGWHVVALNTEEPVDPDSEQLRWLRGDLRRSRARCTVAYMHHPRFSSGKHGDIEKMEPVWQVLYEVGVDVVLAGHDHHYERFAPQTPDGRVDGERGIRQFIVGTGGAPSYALQRTARNSEVRNARARGVLTLTFHDGGYEWAFVPVRGHTFTDRGRGVCH